MLTSRITKGKIKIFRTPLWRSVFALVGLLTLNLWTLNFVWQFYLS